MRRATTALDSIAIKGNQFVHQSTGTRFLARGVTLIGQSQSSESGAAPQSPDSALLWGDLYTLEITGFLSLGVNLVMIFIDDTTQDRSSCISQFADAGIYLLVVLYRDNTDSTSDVYSYQTAAIDSLSPYPNILGFALLTETYDPEESSDETEPLTFVKAQTRDIKEHIRTSKYRDIPIGVIGLWDTSSISSTIATQYLRCGNSSDEVIDFYMLGVYCTNSGVQINSTILQSQTTALQDFGIPLVFVNQGCNFSTNTPDYSWAASILTPPLSSVWSGAIIDSWFQQEPGLDALYMRLVNITTDQGTLLLNESTAFSALQSQLDLITAKTTPTAVYPPTLKVSSCPTVDASFGASTKLPPRPNPQLCSCMMSSLSCVVPEAIPAGAVPNLLDDVCLEDRTSCIGVFKNGTSAVYGAYSSCSMYQQYSWALNRLAITQSKTGKPTNCSFSTWGRSQTPSVSATCSSMLLQAGVFGNGTVKLQTTSPTSSSRSSIFTSIPGTDSQQSSGSELGAGGIAGISNSPKPSLASKPSAEGLELGEASPGLGHNVELGGESRKAEMWTKGNTSELPASIPLQELSDGMTVLKPSTPRSPERGEYAAVPRVDPEAEELDATGKIEVDAIVGKGIKRKPLASQISSL
ncbi:Glucanosyltransferase-domain-containing protein [Cadophora sp. MPI-SDFR-AT-0126]|nr:Glucanosyltransferase-domain-containing protein [Leotiomycetes sp. MPI-SDFR-AT-0126]